MSSSLCTGFTFDQRLGMYLGIQSSFLSAAAVIILLSYAFIRWWKRRGQKSQYMDASGSSLFLNLMVADLLQAIGSMPSIRWMREGTVTAGSLCTAQAVIKQIGINGVALSFCIGIHTFGVLVLQWKVPRHASKLAVVFIWVFIALVVGIPNAVHRKEVYYGPTGYWCWIDKKHTAARIVTEYVWVWASGLIMAILYGIMFLVMRGFLVVDGGINYPAVYIICVFPNSLSRWLSFTETTDATDTGGVPFQYTLFASALFAFSGLFNVILYFSTRPEYAVGPSAEHTTVTATLPTTANTGHLPHHDDSKQPSTNEEGAYPALELHKTQYGRQQNGLGHTNGATSTITNASGHGHLSGQHSASRLGSATHTAASRGPSHQVDDDDDGDYGRLPS
ncbi:hypothetical protein DFP72DRAFT_986958 [Ephemerocybe angulata]|uniref:Glucose receptor Git3 N-terminal domain-containing protein n=1 Tax=Ephemerocybe angulata TaxID=980116 RepID=A0A8H6MG86_9AGAR|nr:hypothetical protein DFP72DRAFT_986958 [Tulosesus angulatus]